MINKLVDKIKKQNAPVVVGLDPMMKFVPKHLQDAAFKDMERHLRVQQKLYGSSTKLSLIIYMI